ncbi:MAG TPA: TIGR03435 family protein [Candidatus Sulfotelmatobacter sp.]|nr:TIGR03435 family protein [Candidatus Sulfotelmatobacter sp.]
MSFRKGLLRIMVVTAPFVFLSVATQTWAQLQDENANAAAPLYKTASVKLSKSDPHAGGTTTFGTDELTATNEFLGALIAVAYDVHEDQIVGAPNWLNPFGPRYDIRAKADNPGAGEGGERMLQGVLADYFKLAVHRETRLIPVYELTLADGSKLRESVPGSAPDYDSHLRVIQVEKGRIVGREVPIATLARILSEQLGRPVLDKTQLPYHYDVTLLWQVAPDSSEPAILDAVQDQLGLKLVPRLTPKEFLTIEHVEMPSAD